MTRAEYRGPEHRVFTGERVRMGQFRAAADAPWFRDSGPARAALIVFPRLPVAIKHRDRPTVLADASQVMFYNRGDEYTRACVAPDGDRCEWFAFDEADVAAALSVVDPRAADARRFSWTHGPGDARSYAAQRALFARLARGERIDPLVVEESALALLDGAVRRAARSVAAPRVTATQRALADAAATWVARRFTDSLSLTQIAGAVGASPFHVARMFRAVTGRTLHAYQNLLRLHHALERVVQAHTDDDLTRIALDAGFSSHSHFTLAFRRTFGAPPSVIRRRARL